MRSNAVKMRLLAVPRCSPLERFPWLHSITISSTGGCEMEDVGETTTTHATITVMTTITMITTTPAESGPAREP